MLKINFSTKLEFDIYIGIKKVDMKKGYLTASERKQLQQMIDNPASYIVAPKEIKVAKPLITNYKQLRIPCEPVTKEDDIKSIIKDLKDALDVYGGIGISANQIGINKRISYLRIPSVTEDKKIKIDEIILINAKIIEHSGSFIFKKEGCISFPGLFLDTDRYIFITISNYNEKLEPNTFLSQDFEACVIQHEEAHLRGLTLLEFKHRTK